MSDFAGKRVLITGTTGFIGGALARRLQAILVAPVNLLLAAQERGIRLLPTGSLEEARPDASRLEKTVEWYRRHGPPFGKAHTS